VALVALLVAPVLGADESPQRPEFPDLTLTSPSGQIQTLSTFRGTIAVLNFWATWCGPCRMELPELEKVYNELGAKGFVVLAINVEGPRAPVGPFMQRMGLELPVYFADLAEYQALGIGSIPFTVLLDRDGRAVRVYAGYSPAAMADLRKLATELLGEGKD